MSFSKAKIQRFNDVKLKAPCPAPVKNKAAIKVQGASDKSSEKSSEVASVKSTPCFRQPNLINKKPSATSGKTKSPSYSIECIELEALKEKIVECENKDASIKDLSEQLEEVKIKMLRLEKANSKLFLEISKYEEAIGELNIEHSHHLRILSEHFQEDLLIMQVKETRLKQEIQDLKNECQLIKETNQRDLVNLENDISQCKVLTKKITQEHNDLILVKNQELQQKEQELKALELNCIEMQKMHSLEIERLQKEHQLEIQDIEFEMLKTMTDLQKEREQVADKIKEIEAKMAWELKASADEFEKEKMNILLESEEKVKEIERKCSEREQFLELECQEKVREIEKEWQNKLMTQEKQADDILKECQAISEYNIIQSEVEKNKVQVELSNKSEELQSMKEKYTANLKKYDDLNFKLKTMQNNFTKNLLELTETKKWLEQQLSEKEAQITQMTKDKLTCDVTIKYSQVTIDVLKKRLINSDKDVEQLKEELTKCEEKLLKYEQTCLQLMSDLKQSQTYNEELEMQYESTIKINRTEIEQLSNDLIKKVQSYKEEVEKMKKEFEEEQKTNQEIMNSLQEAHEFINKLKGEIEGLEPVQVQYKFEIEQSQNELDDYRMREMDWNLVKDKYEAIIKDLEQNLEMRMEEISDLKKQLECVKEQNKDNLVSKNNEQDDICRKYIQISGRYDELLERFVKLETENMQKAQKISELTKALEDSSDVKTKYEQEKKECELLRRKIKPCEGETDNKKDEHSLKTIRKLEEEKNKLNVKVENLKDELKEVSEKYTHLVGHQNNRQKIKHLEDLKIKNSELRQTNIDLDSKVRTYTKKIEKLKKENSDLKKKLKKNKFPLEDKENICSPNKSLNSSRLESPFRNRN